MNLRLMKQIGLTTHDMQLITELLECLPLDEVAEKFEVEPSDLAQVVSPIDTYISPRLFRNRLKIGLVRFADDHTLEKRCTMCREYLPLTREFWYSNVTSADMLSGRCGFCGKQVRNEKYAKRKTEVERLVSVPDFLRDGFGRVFGGAQ